MESGRFPFRRGCQGVGCFYPQFWSLGKKHTHLKTWYLASWESCEQKQLRKHQIL